jgi:hypothetical protein
VVRIADLFEAEAVRCDDLHGRVADGRREHLRRPGGRTTALTDREQRAHQGAHHVVTERVGHDDADRHSVGVAQPVEAAQRADRRRPLPASAEGREVMLAEQQRRGLVHRRQVQRAGIPERVVPAQRIGVGRMVADPVGVPPPQRGEAGVEPLGGGPDRVHPDVRRQRPRQPPQCGGAVLFPDRRRQVRVRHLPAGVHPAVGPAGHGQPDRLRQPQHVPEDPGQLLLHGPLPGLRRPPGEVRPVVGEVDSHPDHGILGNRGRVRRRGWPLAHRFRRGAGQWRAAGEVTGPFGMSLILNVTPRLVGK